MSCDKNITVTLNIHTAATIREQLLIDTKQDSYEFPGKRTIAIREAILALDESIEANLSEDHTHE